MNHHIICHCISSFCVYICFKYIKKDSNMYLYRSAYFTQSHGTQNRNRNIQGKKQILTTIQPLVVWWSYWPQQKKTQTQTNALSGSRSPEPLTNRASNPINHLIKNLSPLSKWHKNRSLSVGHFHRGKFQTYTHTRIQKHEQPCSNDWWGTVA